MKTTNIIANEYQISTNSIKSRIENHFIKDRIYDNSDNSLIFMNQAEIKAMKEEQIRLEEELRKRKQIEEINKKLQEKVKAQKLSEKDKLEKLKKLEQEKKTKSEKIKEFNQKIRHRQVKEEISGDQVQKENRNKNISKKNIKVISDDTNCYSEEINLNPSSPKFNTTLAKNNQTFSFNESLAKDNNLLKEDQPILVKTKPTIEKEFNFINQKNYESLNNPNISKKALTDKIYDGKMNSPQEINLNNNRHVINLRDRILKSIKDKLDSEFQPMQKQNFDANCLQQNIKEELNKNIDSVRVFRKTGIVNLNSNSNLNNNENYSKQELSSNRIISHQIEKLKGNELDEKEQKQNELEKRRYTKALRNIMIEKFKEKSIVIPNICSCGQLQKKLDTLLENKNISVYSIVDVECANNCIYYNNTNDYHKALSDIINSVKNLKYETFHN